MNRRTFLAAAGALSAAPEPFRYRGYLGWITDLASGPEPGAAWPSMRLDERLLADYRESFAVMKATGFTELSVWGLYVSRAWPVDIRSAVTPERGRRVERLIDAAHAKGIRVLSGLGIYSWGFEEIIKANPQLTRGNPRAMCASEPASWRWMQKVIDFVFERFPIDGVSMQSADQGRCRCQQCSRSSDAEYHALLNLRSSEYIRSRWPKKIIGVNSWGLRFEEPETLPSLLKVSRHVDYLIDVHDSSRKRDPGYRKKIISSLACPFGTLGGPQVEPPQHWARDRWFLPTLRSVGQHLEELHRDGGRACEYFYHILKNPGCEVSMRLAGKVLSHPETGWETHLSGIVEEVFGVSKAAARDELCALLLDAESAYLRHLAPNTCGTISLEPLVSSEPGPPVYLTRRLTAAQRASYAAELPKLAARFRALAPEVRRREKVDFILRCLENAGKDL